MRLTVLAPFSGRVRASEQLHPERWVSPEMPLLTLVEPAALKVNGLVDERNLRALEVGQSGVFLPDRGDGSRLGVELIAVDIGAVFALPYPELASVYGGHVPVRTTGDGRHVPEGAYYRVAFSVTNAKANWGQIREPGMVVVTGTRRSWVWLHLKQVMAALVRESGF